MGDCSHISSLFPKFNARNIFLFKIKKPPLITFLVSLNLEKESFIRTTATMYFLASIPLYSSLIYHGLGNIYDLLISLVVTAPALLGQYFGTKIRMKLSNDIFRKTILSILIIWSF